MRIEFIVSLYTYNFFLLFSASSWCNDCCWNSDQQDGSSFEKGGRVCARQDLELSQTRTQPLVLFARWLMGRFKRVHVASREGKKKNSFPNAIARISQISSVRTGYESRVLSQFVIIMSFGNDLSQPLINPSYFAIPAAIFNKPCCIL